MEPNSTVELPDQGDNIIRTRDLNITPFTGGLGYEIFTNLKKHKPENTAQIDAETGETDNYGNLLSRIIRVALHLKARSVQPGDVIAPCTSNHFNSTVVFVAPLLLGAKVACFDPNALYADMKFLIELVKPKVMFAEECAVEKLKKIREELSLKMEIVVFGHTDKEIPFDEFLQPFPGDEEDGFEPHQVKDLSETAPSS
ncbi:AMP-binding enzyme [Popillia japonica]|uniref:AMP-binding enzyme n=1 Tax=Popillia japonica TaxID=7064 RepID=A0AAW1KIP2_POPJA